MPDWETGGSGWSAKDTLDFGFDLSVKDVVVDRRCRCFLLGFSACFRCYFVDKMCYKLVSFILNIYYI